MKNPAETAEFFIHINQPKQAKIVLDLLKPYAISNFELDQLGQLYSQIKSHTDTLELAIKLYELELDSHSKHRAQTNIIQSYLNLNQPEQALDHIISSEAQYPNDPLIQMNKALALLLLGYPQQGEAVLTQVLEKCNDLDVTNRVKFNLGTYELKKGNFKAGLAAILVGGQSLGLREPINLPQNQLWTGGVQPGKTILVYAEGGIGDEIISIRFIRHFRDKGMHPIWYTTRSDIAKVFTRCGFDVIDRLDQLPADWVWTPSMSVPCYLDLTEDQLWYGSYLSAHRRCPQLPGTKKIGIKVSGNSMYEHELHRSIPLAELLNCIPQEYTIYSFHVDEEINHPRVIPLKDYISSWEDTLDYLDQMDFVASSCTSLIHAAGAMSKDAAVFVPILSYYPWCLPGSTSKWYNNNLTVLRQVNYKNWRAPLDQLTTILHAQ